MVDDENRENEGDLLMAAEKVRPEDINYMARYGRGLICLTITRERCAQLRLPLMVDDTDRRHATNFTVSIEAAEGITTGISAHDRARTVQIAVAPDAKPEHLGQPGHIFPVMAQPGGVLTRAGHTEAGCDLARLAGFEPAAAIVEILNEDGSMARRPDLEAFSREHGVRIGTIADLIRYRLEKERYVERIAEKTVQTAHGEFGLFCYDDHVNRTVHVALVKGEIGPDTNPLVRVHIQDTLGDVLGVQSPVLGWPLQSAIERIARENAGIVVVLRERESSRELMEAVGILSLARNELAGRRDGEAVLKTYGVGAQILRDLGVQRMRVLSAPKQMHGISGFDLEITEYVES
jgi:3,4-dihydroxy 2-butanone 4-phosphate synthase/GTP cyclohydrolase II